jgi:hypothetical protein
VAITLYTLIKTRLGPVHMILAAPFSGRLGQLASWNESPNKHRVGIALPGQPTDWVEVLT